MINATQPLRKRQPCINDAKANVFRVPTRLMNAEADTNRDAVSGEERMEGGRAGRREGGRDGEEN